MAKGLKGTSPQFKFMATLDHSLYFHEIFGMDDWVLWETKVCLIYQYNYRLNGLNPIEL